MSTTANAAPPSEWMYCGLIHKAICPKIKRIEYSDMNPGLYKVVEFFAPNDYPKPESAASIKCSANANIKTAKAIP